MNHNEYRWQLRNTLRRSCTSATHMLFFVGFVHARPLMKTKKFQNATSMGKRKSLISDYGSLFWWEVTNRNQKNCKNNGNLFPR